MKIEEFKVGKWYKNLGDGKEWIGKFEKLDNGSFASSQWLTPTKIYDTQWGVISNSQNAELCTPEEIYEFLPENHPDKIKPLKIIDDLRPLIKLLENIK